MLSVLAQRCRLRSSRAAGEGGSPRRLSSGGYAGERSAAQKSPCFVWFRLPGSQGFHCPMVAAKVTSRDPAPWDSHPEVSSHRGRPTRVTHGCGGNEWLPAPSHNRHVASVLLPDHSCEGAGVCQWGGPRGEDSQVRGQPGPGRSSPVQPSDGTARAATLRAAA